MSGPALQESVDALAALLRNASRTLLFTGAGISTGSGIPDYRGPQGVWKHRQPVYYQDFLRSREAQVEYWDTKLEGYRAFRDAEPNAVHRAAVELERAGKLECVVTQNIDGLHGKAGLSTGKLVELHGTNARVDCQSCEFSDAPAEYFERFARERTPPLCPRCNGLLKSATISFGQSLRAQDLDRAARAAEAADLVISLGSTLSVTPAAHVPLAAAARGVPYAIINRGETEHDGRPEVTLRLEGDVGQILPPAVTAAVQAQR